MFCPFSHLCGCKNRELQNYCWLPKNQPATSLTWSRLGQLSLQTWLLAWRGRVTHGEKPVMLADRWSFGGICTREHNWLFQNLDNQQLQPRNVRRQAHAVLGPPTEVRSIKNKSLGQIVTVSVAQNTVLGKHIITVPYTETNGSSRMLWKLPRELQCCFWQHDHTVTPKPHLLSPRCTELSQLPPSSNIVLFTCSSLAVPMGLAISGWYF